MLRIGIVANEVSGDLLGAGLIREIRSRIPEAVFEGIGGPEMIREGCNSLYPMERLSVMGLVEVLKHLPELLSIRRHLVAHFLQDPPDLFIGVDAPDFNLGLSRKLKGAGIPTVQYVSPTVWAWRQGRVKTIRKSVDLVLSILPFETDFLNDHQVPASYVGHPMADEIPFETDRNAARARLGLEPNQPVLALLPGSRRGEIRILAESMIRGAAICRERVPGLRIISPMVNHSIRDTFETQWKQVAPDLPILLVDGLAREAMTAADVVLTFSGTATLEAALLKRPMVVAYRMHWLSAIIFRAFRLYKLSHISLPNLLAGKELVPELIQEAATPEALSEAVITWLDSPERAEAIRQEYQVLHETLRRDASSKAAGVVLGLIGWNSGEKGTGT
jgi:lipid-A-disaccharide synthase